MTSVERVKKQYELARATALVHFQAGRFLTGETRRALYKSAKFQVKQAKAARSLLGVLLAN
jgi:hypothetical protein